MKRKPVGDPKRKKVQPNLAVLTVELKAERPEDLLGNVTEMTEYCDGYGHVVRVEYYEEA